MTHASDDFVFAVTLQSDECRVTFDELCRATGFAAEEVRELVEFGVFEPAGGTPDNWVFAGQTIVLARTAQRLRRHFDVNIPGLALALTYLQQIEQLQQHIRLLECRQLK